MYTTDKALIEQIRNGDEISWNIFYHEYKYFIHAIGTRMHLSESDNEELLQQVMIAIFNGRKTFSYNPNLGKFRNYLSKLVFNQIGELFRKKTRNEVKYIQKLDDRFIDLYTETFNNEYRKHMLKMAMDELKNRVESTTFEAFYLSNIQGRKTKDIANALGLAEGSIYVYKARCVKLLKQIVKEISLTDKDFKL